MKNKRGKRYNHVYGILARVIDDQQLLKEADGYIRMLAEKIIEHGRRSGFQDDGRYIAFLKPKTPAEEAACKKFLDYIFINITPPWSA